MWQKGAIEVEYREKAHGVCKMLCVKIILDKSGMPINMQKLAEI